MKYIILSITLFSIQVLAFSQERTSMVLDSSYFENLILNTDRELYIAGEKIWFKVNCFDNETNPETILSKIVYLELYDYKEKTVSKGKFRIINGTATGFLKIPVNLSSGNYYLRTYTQFLRNYSSYLFPGSIISIINPGKFNIQNGNSPTDDILIVPEGGKLIAGVPSKLAIRINPKLNRKLRESIILDNHKNEIIKFTPSANGLALVEITPNSSVQYFLKLAFDDSSSILKPIPTVFKNGMVLRSSYTGSKLKIRLISNTISSGGTKVEYKVEIKSQNYKTLLIREIRSDEPLEIQGNQLTNGLVYILLKDKDDDIIYISSKFISKILTGEIEIKKSKDVFKSRELAEFDVNIPQNCSRKSNYLITVTKTGTNNNSKNLLPVHITYNPLFFSNYLKTSFIKSNSLKEQVNIVLILFSKIYNSKSFREGIQQDNVIKFLPEIRDVGINGKVVDKTTKKPLNNIMVYASVFGESKQFHLYRTKPDGEFFFSLNHLTKKQDVFICTKPIDSLQVKILINNDFSNKYPHTDIIPLDMDSSKHKLLEQLYLNAQVSKAFENHVDKIQKNISFYPLLTEDHEISISLKDFIEIPLMTEVFEEIIPFVLTRKRKGQYYLKLYDNKDNADYYPIVLVDGVPVFDINKIMKISPELIDKINVTRRKYYLGDYILPGIISIKTKTKNFAGISFPDESVFLNYHTVTTESYPLFPVDKSMVKKDRIPDFRNLLYWNPYLLPGHERKKIKFYTSDECGDYDIIIKGYNHNKHYYGKISIKVGKKAN
ncbi:MAG: hypothetical protein DRI95_00115 [Bacteroidetes bacterium]|nr:MAG: hypothetical protein DRI95_00115 [Bacteroidota bacterium]